MLRLGAIRNPATAVVACVERLKGSAMRASRLTVLFFCIFGLCSCNRSAASAGLSVQHPDDRSKSVEYFVEKPSGNGPWPAIVLLHGHQEGARPGGRVFADWGVLKKMAARGYLAVAVSQPGYGNSAGPADFSGPFTQHAVSAVIAKLKSDDLAAANGLLIEGISRGAVTAGLIASDDQTVSGVVLISGVYDLPTYVADSAPTSDKLLIVRAIKAETGGEFEALNSRSVLRHADKIKASVLILNGAKDDRTVPSQARELADKVNEGGGTARAIIYPDFGHSIPVGERDKEVDPFIDQVLAHSK